MLTTTWPLPGRNSHRQQLCARQCAALSVSARCAAAALSPALVPRDCARLLPQQRRKRLRRKRQPDVHCAKLPRAGLPRCGLPRSWAERCCVLLCSVPYCAASSVAVCSAAAASAAAHAAAATCAAQMAAMCTLPSCRALGCHAVGCRPVGGVRCCMPRCSVPDCIAYVAVCSAAAQLRVRPHTRLPPRALLAQLPRASRAAGRRVRSYCVRQLSSARRLAAVRTS